jgi:osmoprotectant transport system substrate-binding protein
MMHRLTTVVVLLALAACSGNGDRLVVGSKNFTENLFLGELLAQHIEARTGLVVERRLNLGGTFLCHQALRAGQIDLYPEYTGTALTAILKRPVVRDAGEVYRSVAAAYEQDLGAAWTEPFGFNNTFAIVVAGDKAQAGGWTRISDLAAPAPKLTIGFNFEFFERQDGYHGLTEAYHLKFLGDPKTMDMSLVYTALRDGQIDIGVGNSTDGLIDALKLRVLDDDRHFFPPYDAAPVVRLDTLRQHPGLREALAELGGILTEQEMRRWNYEIDGNQRSAADVARELRRVKGLP